MAGNEGYKITPIDWDRLYGTENTAEPEGENFCTTDTCEIPR